MRDPLNGKPDEFSEVIMSLKVAFMTSGLARVESLTAATGKEVGHFVVIQLSGTHRQRRIERNDYGRGAYEEVV